MNDPIVDEIRRFRDAHAAQFNYDLEAIYHDIKRREKEREEKTGRKFVSYPPRRIEPPTALKSGTPAAPMPSNTTVPDETPAIER